MNSPTIMKTPAKIAVVLGIAIAAAAVMVLKNNKSSDGANSNTPGVATDATAAGAKLPKLLDLGATKCIPCKMMAPILEDLKKEYAGRMNVEFIDVWEHENAGEEYKVEIIPTQIFYDAAGKELFRHTGFFGKDDILAKWKELGVDLGGGRPSTVIVREPPVAAGARPRDTRVSCAMRR